MPKSVACNTGKKNGPSAKLSSNEGNFASSRSLLQNIHEESPVTENDTSTGAKKRKKKKKKNQSTDDLNSANIGDDDKTPKVPPVPTDLENLSKLHELTVIMLPQTSEVAAEKTEKQLVNGASDNNNETTVSKKKKKKKKQKNAVAQAETQGAPTVSASVIPGPLPSTQSSHLKMTQSRSSPVIFVNPFENSKKDSTVDALIGQAFSNMSIGVKAEGSNSSVKYSEGESSLYGSQLKYGAISSLGKSSVGMQQDNFVSITQIYDGNNGAKNEPTKHPANSIEPGNPVSLVDSNSAPQKSKAELKAERRAVQEAQRAAKEASKKAAGIVDAPKQASKPITQPKSTNFPPPSHMSRVSKESQKVSFFSHLPQFKSTIVLQKHLESDDCIHPAIVAIGAKYAKETISESNSCCIGILAALKKVIEDYKTPPNKELRRDLGSKIDMCTSFISKCRPLSVGTLNALKFLKLQIGNIPVNQPDDKAKKDICEQVEKFVKDSICLALAAISELVSFQIRDGDVILTYAYSSAVRNALYEAHERNKKFKVVIIDSRPTMEGKAMLRCLLKRGISCSYALISALTFAMKDVSRVIIGAHTVRASGYVVSRIGASQIALLASSLNIPFLVCCESYKFCDRALIDSFVDNELGDPENFAKIDNCHLNVLENWKEVSHLDLLNLLYDVTPPHLISKIITEKNHFG